ncbi:MAG: type I methionyl aminopeptidase [Candidatus Krumholzibacteriota bacterium]|nr:type I methionyl aminopeptidase [Candidatus Krumholzibacteriota bacterium]
MIYIKNDTELDLIRKSGEVLKDTFLEIEKLIRVGVTTGELDRYAEEYIHSRGCVPAFKGYQGYPASICASVNEEVVHGIPGARKLEDGDIVGIDMGVIREEFYSDATRTFAVGEINEEARRLIEVTRESLDLGIEKARAGNHLSDISHAIQEHAEKNGFSVVRSLVGHGIGRQMHEEPQIPNFGPPGKGPVLQAGMVLAIEPMVNVGTENVYTLKDKWTFVTVDRNLSCHFEDTVAVTENGPEIMTR